MFVSDGIVYAGGSSSDIRVNSARVTGDGCMLITFSTGETRLFDSTELLDIPVYESLADESVLRSFSIDHGVLTWVDGEIDIAPEALYARSYAYEMSA